MDWINSSLDCLGVTFYPWTLNLILHLGKWYQVICCKTSLTTGRYKDDHWFAVRKLLYMIECWFIHCPHTRAIMFLAESFKMNFYWNWAYSGSEVKESILVSSEPFSNISTVGHGSRKSDHSYLGFFIHSADNHFQNCSSFLAKQVDFIKNN